jgi:hypothetical protein
MHGIDARREDEADHVRKRQGGTYAERIKQIPCGGELILGRLRGRGARVYQTSSHLRIRRRGA